MQIEGVVAQEKWRLRFYAIGLHPVVPMIQNMCFGTVITPQKPCTKGS